VTIKATLSGALLTVEAIDVLSMDDLPSLFAAFDQACGVAPSSRDGAASAPGFRTNDGVASSRRPQAPPGPFVVLTDTTRMKAAPRAVISAFADGLKKRPELKAVWLGDAVVVSSPTVRFVLSTLLVVAPMPTEVKAFDQMQEAKRWCAWILRRAGVTVPAELARLA
jgi:hypothetical protein